MKKISSIILSVSLLVTANYFGSEATAPITPDTKDAVLQICQQIIQTPELTPTQLPNAQTCLEIIKLSTQEDSIALQASKKIYDFITQNIHDLTTNHADVLKNFMDQFQTLDLTQYAPQTAILISLIALPIATASLPNKHFLTEIGQVITTLGQSWELFDGSLESWQKLLTTLNNQSIITFLTNHLAMTSSGCEAGKRTIALSLHS